MEHQDQYTQQKVLRVIHTRTVQSPSKNAQDRDEVVLDDNPENNLTDHPLAVDEQENKGGNFPPLTRSAFLQKNNHVSPTFQQSSHIQHENSPGSKELNSFLNCLPQPQDQPGCIYNNGPCQTINMMPGASPGASPTSPISNKRSFNTRNTHSGPYIINHGHITIESTIYEGEDIDGAGTPTSRNQEKENESWEPSSPSVYCAGKDITGLTNPMTKVVQATTRGPRVQMSTSNSQGNILCSHNPSPSTSTQPQVQNRSLCPAAEGLQPAHTIPSNHDEDDTSLIPQPRETSDLSSNPSSTSVSGAPSQFATAELDRPDGIQTSIDTQNMFHRLLPHRFRSGSLHSNHNDTSVRTWTSKSWPAPSKSIRSFFARSRLSRQSISPYCSETLRPFPNERIPIFRKGTLDKIVDVYMNADLDPSKGIFPKFHPLWDPHITHYRSSDRSLPPVYSVNVYDVGHFDTAGRFILLFNLLLSKEENEKLLKFEFKKIHFVPLTGVAPNALLPLRGSNLIISNRTEIRPDCSNRHVHNPHAYKRHFIIPKGLNAGAVIAVLGELLHYSSNTNVIQVADNNLFNQYFSTQSIEWYRHARHDRQCLVENGELVLITDTYKAASWGYFAYYSKKGADKDHSVSFCQEPSDGSYHWNYDVDGCESYQKEPSTGSESPMDQCIGFRAYAIRCPVAAWNSICNSN